MGTVLEHTPEHGACTPGAALGPEKRFVRAGVSLGRGDAVEVLMREDGLQGSKYGAVVREVREVCALVEFDEFKEEVVGDEFAADDAPPLTEWYAFQALMPPPPCTVAVPD